MVFTREGGVLQTYESTSDLTNRYSSCDPLRPIHQKLSATLNGISRSEVGSNYCFPVARVSKGQAWS